MAEDPPPKVTFGVFCEALKEPPNGLGAPVPVPVPVPEGKDMLMLWRSCRAEVVCRRKDSSGCL